jgi:transposase
MNAPVESVVGIDVSKKKLDVLLLQAGKGRSKVVANTAAGHAQLVRWLLQHRCVEQSTHVCLEATGAYSEPVALALTDAGWKLSVVNPARIKGFAQGELSRNKTDRADAGVLARFCAAMKPELWEPPTREVRQLRAWVDRLQALKDMRQQELNRIEALQSAEHGALKAHVQAHVAWLDEQIAALERDIDDHIDRHPQLRGDAQLLETIPGVGATTAAKLLAYAGDVRRFESAKALAAFVGTCPRQRQSGSSLRGRTTMSRAGHKTLRTALYMPALVARRHNKPLKGFADRLEQRGMAPKSVIGAVMRKLTSIIYGVIKSGMPFNPSLAMPRLDAQDGI